MAWTISSHRVVCVGELAASFRREAVVAGAAVVLGRAPERRDPAAILESMQRGIEGSMFDLEHVVRPVRDGVRDGVAVRRANRESLEDEEVECALQELRPASAGFHVSACAPQDNLPRGENDHGQFNERRPSAGLDHLG